MRQTLHEKTLLLVQERLNQGVRLQELAPLARVSYVRLWQWVHKQDEKSARLNVDAVQRLYEHLTGKELDY